MNKTERILRGTGVVVCQLFAAATIVRLLPERQYERLLIAVATPLLVFVPELVERLFRCRIATPIYLFCLFYAIGPMLGHCYDFYYLVSWWDKMLHISGGVLFAVLGLHLFGRFAGKGKQALLFGGIFALCFSMTVAVVWEFAEFGADQLAGVDMQSDSVVTSIRSYSLGDGMGVAGVIEHIETVTVNGKPLPIKGYLDIGLVDTMWDMILESLGALVVVILFLIDRGRHLALVARDGEKKV